MQSLNTMSDKERHAVAQDSHAGSVTTGGRGVHNQCDLDDPFPALLTLSPTDCCLAERANSHP